MSLALSSASATADTTIRVQFSESFLQNAALFEKSNYAFRVRFGPEIRIYAKRVTTVSTSAVDVTLRDATLLGGHYELTVLNMAALSDGVPIQDGAGPNTAIFDSDTVGDALRCFDIRKRVPPFLDTKSGSRLHAVLCAVGTLMEELGGDGVESAINQIARGLLLRTAEDEDLSVIGQNFGVTRNIGALSVDDLYRKLIPSLATKRKSVLGIFFDVLEKLVGLQSTEGWNVFTIEANKLIIEIPQGSFQAAAGGDLDSATYLHVDATVPGGTSYLGDYLLPNAGEDGSDIDDNIVIAFSVSSIDALLEQVKAAGIELTVDITG